MCLVHVHDFDIEADLKVNIENIKPKISAERELVEFLTEEILNERKAQKTKTIPTELDGFKAHLNGAEVTLTKEQDNEKYNINLFLVQCEYSDLF